LLVTLTVCTITLALGLAVVYRFVRYGKFDPLADTILLGLIGQSIAMLAKTGHDYDTGRDDNSPQPVTVTNTSTEPVPTTDTGTDPL
jgi:hypothetical protein